MRRAAIKRLMGLIIGAVLLTAGLVGEGAAAQQPPRLIKIGALTESWGPSAAIVGLRDGLQNQPGFVATEWTSQWPDERKRASIERTLMKRPCTAADIAGAIVFLCADNSMITAQTLVVDGGYSL